MTAIWDAIGGVAFELSEPAFPWSDIKSKNLLKVTKAIYDVIKEFTEYQDLVVNLDYKGSSVKLLSVLAPIVEEPVLDSKSCSQIAICVSRLHDFDHEDLPYNGQKTYGHHTEMVLGSRKAKKTLGNRARSGSQSMFEALKYKDWWLKDVPVVMKKCRDCKGTGCKDSVVDVPSEQLQRCETCQGNGEAKDE